MGDRQLSALGHTTETQKMHAIVILPMKSCTAINYIYDSALIGLFGGFRKHVIILKSVVLSILHLGS